MGDMSDYNAKLNLRRQVVRKLEAKISALDGQIQTYQTARQNYVEELEEKKASLARMESMIDRALKADQRVWELRRMISEHLAKPFDWTPSTSESELPINHPDVVAWKKEIAELEVDLSDDLNRDVNRVYYGKAE